MEPTAEHCEAEAERAVARGDALLAVIWRARAACIRNGKVVKTRRPSPQLTLEVVT